MLNETNITIINIDVARVLVSSQTETNTIKEIIIPLASVLITGLIAYYTIKYNAKNIFIQSNEEKIKSSIENLAKRIERGQNTEILAFLNTSEGIYVPAQIKSEIRIYAKENIDEDKKIKCWTR
jgi:hypothetical protein